MEQLGVYNIAKDLITRPFSIVNNISANVFSAAFAKIQNDIKAVIFNYSKLVRTISILMVPLYVSMFVFADFIVSVLYAHSFAEVAVFIRILSFVGICSALTSQAGTVMIALGRTDLGLRWTIVRIVFATIVLLITSQMSVYAVAYGQSIMAVILLFLYFFVVIKPMIHIDLGQYCKMFGDIVIVTIIIAMPFAIVNICFNVPVIIQIVMGIVFIAIYLYFINRNQKEILQEMIKSVLPKKHD